MSRKALGRGLGDLLNRAKPARSVDRAAAPQASAQSARRAFPQSLPLEPATDATPTDAPGTGEPPANSMARELSDPGATPVRPAEPAPEPPGTRTGRRMPRFGPAYTPPPDPETPSTRSPWYLLLAVDSALLVFAAAIAFGPWVSRPLSLYIAGAAILLGGVLASVAVLRPTSPRTPPAGSPKPSRVRVHLTRL